jgi:undecaprenyl-diphosphatase
MDLLQAIVLGIVQGATEFIPVSSHGHLLLVPWLLGWEAPGLLFDMMLHWGTLFAVVVYFRRDLTAIVSSVLRDLLRGKPFASPDSRLGWLVVVATIPAAVLGYLFEEQFETLFTDPASVAVSLIITGIILWFSETLGRRVRGLNSITLMDALLIGLGQAVAILPAISRSGTTIGVGLARGLERPAAARFSFLMSVPIIFGAGLLKVLDAVETGVPRDMALLMLVGLIAAAITGYLCIAFLLNFLATRSLRTFAVYCWGVGVMVLLLVWARS